MTLKVAYQTGRDRFAEAMVGLGLPIAEAATDTIRQAAEIVKIEGRADIAKAGFSRRWQNTLRVDVYPKGRKVSVNAAAFIYHKISYAGVFEEGATIRGKPTLWVPLPNAPKKIGRDRITPERFTQSVGPLQYIDRPGKKPLLGAKVQVGRNSRAGRNARVSLAALRRGAAGGGNGRMVTKTIPLFVGLKSVDIPKKFNITQITRRAASRLGELYVLNLRGE